MASYYKVPEQFGGKTLQDITKQYGGGFDILGQLLGTSPQTPLTAGQNLQVQNVPGINFGSSSEGQLISKYFEPGISPEQQLIEEQRGRLGEFTGKLDLASEELGNYFNQLGIPEAYESFGTLGQSARDVANRLIDLPGQVEGDITQFAQGRDIGANQLERMIAARTLEGQKGLQPLATETGRALESSQAGLQNLLSQYQTKTSEIFTPLELEANLLSAQSANEFDLFKSQLKNELDREIAKIQEQGAMSRKEIDRAINLAEMENKYEGISYQDLGDRLGVFRGANLIGEEPIRKIATLASQSDSLGIR